MRKDPLPAKALIIAIAMLLSLSAIFCTNSKPEVPVTEKQVAMEEQGRAVSPTPRAESEIQPIESEEENEEEEEAPQTTTGSVGGVIYMDDTPIALGTIQVENTSHRIVARVRSDVVGRYTIRDLAPGSYILRYIKSSGAAYGIGRVVNVRAGVTTDFDIHLTSNE